MRSWLLWSFSFLMSQRIAFAQAVGNSSCASSYAQFLSTYGDLQRASSIECHRTRDRDSDVYRPHFETPFDPGPGSPSLSFLIPHVESSIVPPIRYSPSHVEKTYVPTLSPIFISVAGHVERTVDPATWRNSRNQQPTITPAPFSPPVVQLPPVIIAFKTFTPLANGEDGYSSGDVTVSPGAPPVVFMPPGPGQQPVTLSLDPQGTIFWVNGLETNIARPESQASQESDTSNITPASKTASPATTRDNSGAAVSATTTSQSGAAPTARVLTAAAFVGFGVAIMADFAHG